MKNFCLVTGATGGLGGSFATELASKGHNLLLVGRKKIELEKLKLALEKLHKIEVLTFVCDQTSADDRIALFDFAKDNEVEFEKIVLNAGYIDEGSFIAKNDDVICKIIQTNCEGTIDIFQKAVKCKNVDTELDVIVVSSLAGFYPMPQMAIYAASKSFLINFFVAVRQELKNQNVKISVVCPGAMPTTETMKKAIKAQGVWGEFSSVSTQKVAQLALKKVKKNKAIIVPGIFNKFLHVTGVSVPKTCVASSISKRWKKTQKKQKID